MLKKPQGGQPSRQRGHLRQMIIFALVLVIVAAVSLSGWCIYTYKAKPYDQAVVRVNGVTFNMRYFVNTLKIYYGTVPSSALFDTSSATDKTIFGDTEIEQFASFVEHQIEQAEIIKQGSLALGVSIERNQIEAELKKSGTPITPENMNIMMAQELMKKQVPAAQPQAHIQALLLESESAAQTAVNRLEAGETFYQLANEISKIPTGKISNGDLGWMTAREINLKVGSTKFGDLAIRTNSGVLSGPTYDDTISKQLGYWVMKVVEKIGATNDASAQVHAQGILLGSEEEAKAVIDQLNGGADINELAKQLSQQIGAKDNGAEFGWMFQGQTAANLDALFSLPVNTVYGPISDNQIETRGGFWVFNVLEKNDNLALTTDQQSLLEKDLLDRFTGELQKDPNYKVENLLTPEKRDFALNETVNSKGAGSVVIHTGSLPDGEAGVSYYYALEIYGNKKGNTWSITKGSLPEGLRLNGSTGVISGLPVNAGLSSFTIKVNSGAHYWQQDLSIRLHFPVSVTTRTLPDGQVGIDYSAMLEILGDSNSYKWSIITGSLPDGLKLDETTGSIYGAPNSAGTARFTVQVDDGLKQATQELSLSIK